jgi:6-phosphogluconolactonase
VRGEIRVVENPAGEAAEHLARVGGAGGHIALAGGSTPRDAYERAAAMDVDWSGATFWFGDERCVPPDDGQSNYRMFKEAFVDRIDGEPPTVRRIAAERGPNAAADDYERDLREALGEQTPRLDLALLGLGPDAHTASLFPEDDALNETGRVAVGVQNAGMEPYVPRVTLTVPVLNATRELLFLVTGRNKAEAVARAFADPPSPAAPASLIDPAGGTMTVLLDEAAAEGIGGQR